MNSPQKLDIFREYLKVWIACHGGTNDSLKIARNLYDKYGFIEVVLDSPKYERGNVKMVLKIKN